MDPLTNLCGNAKNKYQELQQKLKKCTEEYHRVREDGDLSSVKVMFKELQEFKDELDGQFEMSKEGAEKYMEYIWEKHQRGEDMDDADLRFLYFVDGKVFGFKYSGSRRQEILEGRDAKEDIMKATGWKEWEISTTKEEALRGGIKYHIGNLDLRGLSSPEGLVFPKNVSGYLGLSGLTSAEGLVLSKHVGGDLDLSGLRNAMGFVLPEKIGGGLYLSGLTSAEGLVFPKNVGGELDLEGLTSAEALVLPKNVGGRLDLGGLRSAEWLVLPKNVRGNLYLEGLTSTEGLDLSQTTIHGSIKLPNIISEPEKEELRIKYPHVQIQ